MILPKQIVTFFLQIKTSLHHIFVPFSVLFEPYFKYTNNIVEISYLGTKSLGATNANSANWGH